MADYSDLYFYVSSDELTDYYPSNHPNRFTAKTDRDYYLSGTWECCVTEVHFVANFAKPIDRFVYLCCDLVATSSVQGTRKRILRRIDVDGLDLNKTKIYQEFCPYYVEINTYQFQEIRFSLLDSNLRTSSLLSPFSCVLHMRRKY